MQRWLRDYSGEKLSEAEIASRATEMDDVMIADFDLRADELMMSMMRAKNWGFESATNEYRAGEMRIWGEVFHEHLPLPG